MGPPNADTFWDLERVFQLEMCPDFRGEILKYSVLIKQDVLIKEVS